MAVQHVKVALNSASITCGGQFVEMHLREWMLVLSVDSLASHQQVTNFSMILPTIIIVFFQVLFLRILLLLVRVRD